jgi:HD-GYP domain-containing protein (c-di-GMP phosphodiesterase class II)
MASRPALLRVAGRSLTLLRLFLVASALILAVGALALTQRLGGAVRSQAIQDEIDSATVFASAVLAPSVVHGDKIVIDAATRTQLEQSVRSATGMRSVKLWQPDGTLAFATLAPQRIGRNFGVDEDLDAALSTGRAVGFIENLTNSTEAENRAESLSGIGRALTVYVPVKGVSGQPIGAYEVYLATERIDAAVARGTRNLWLTVAAVFGSLYAALALLVRGASKRMRNQTDALQARSAELQESYALLEQSSLDTIETLNATVEAKDPYTAGHSHRVRTMSLLIGRELGLQPDRLELLGAAALFHDVGKIGVPDAILTKPSSLTREEFEIVKQHAARGAEIVAHISALKGAVPTIRHHHERWDGLGYPAGLAGEDIPLEASIVGMADAWDAMTTVRPYASALPVATAVGQLREGRGTQFRPEVVDAFLAVAEQTMIAHVTRLPALRSVPGQRQGAEATG